jgi:hypothetical protein
MRSILLVTVPSDDDTLTTLDRVKAELNITGANRARDTLLQEKIDEASDDLRSALGFRVAQESVIETFWFEQGDYPPEFLLLDRTPEVTIDSITIDDVVYEGDAIAAISRLDDKTGQLYALCDGYPSRWLFCKSIIIAYTGGYVMPSEGDDCTLPTGIQGACVDLVSSYWAAKGRDPTLKSYEVPGVISKAFWVGAVGEDGELPPSVVTKFARYRRAIAV